LKAYKKILRQARSFIDFFFFNNYFIIDFDVVFFSLILLIYEENVYHTVV